ncbi:MAG: tetratricopeptide repeat protein [Verrucomicrobiales bacterium]|nr:tetratricopeptide repeat protein [Verrucomicrobiales bacterium]
MNRVGLAKRQGWFAAAVFCWTAAAGTFAVCQEEAQVAPETADPVLGARLRFDSGQFADGNRVLENALALADVSSDLVREAFYLLEKEEALGREAWLRRLEYWAKETGPRADWAAFYRGVGLRQSGDLAGALAAFSEYVTAETRPPQLLEAANLHQVELLFETEAEVEARVLTAEILAAKPAGSVRSFLRGVQARYLIEHERPTEALAIFEALDPASISEEDLFHEALAALQADEVEVFRGNRERLLERESELLAELDFEEGLFLASQADTAAFDKLAAFLRNYPTHQRAADAEIALAEMHLNQALPQPQAARDRQASASRRPLMLDQEERLHFSQIWTEQIAGNLPAMVKRAERFLEAWPHSERRPEVMMMLGQAHFELGEYPRAIVHFERLSANQGDPAKEEAALFFTAKAASLTMTFENHEKALTLWDVVAERGGPLAAQARHEQGLLHLAHNRLDDALESFQAVLTRPPGEVPPELVIATLCDVGHAQFLNGLAAQSAGEDGAPLLQAAIESFEAADGHPASTTAWKFQAQVRRGKCYEALGKTAEALKIYRSVVANSPATRSVIPAATIPTEEFDWLYRAGFSAVEILEGQKNWKEAVNLAELLAETSGPRSIEAGERANRLRLRHFVWDE